MPNAIFSRLARLTRADRNLRILVVAALNEMQDLADCVGAIYEAATGDGSWLDVGARLRRLFAAPLAILRLGQDGVSASVLMPTDQVPRLLDPHIQAIDPYRARAQHDFVQARPSPLGSARLGPDLVPDEVLLSSAFYNDFARHLDMRHMIGGIVGISDATPIALFRGNGAQPFGTCELQLMNALLPHLQRALELAARLDASGQASRLTLAALDRLPVGIGIIDTELKIGFINDVARTHLASQKTSLDALQSGPRASSGIHLAARSPDATRQLRQLVASAVSGGSGGSLRLGTPSGVALAVLVAPLPPTLRDEVASRPHGARHERHALLVVRPIDQTVAPPAGMLCSLFGFTKAEEEVAIALAGGATAQQVASQRRVSLLTIRSQVRAILEKSESGNLRDLERSMAALGTLAPRDPKSLLNGR